MKILSHKADANKHVYNFVVTPDDGVWAKEIKKEIAKAAKTVKLRGYRPGKVPPNIALKYLNQQMIIRACLNKILPSIYKELMDNEDVQKQNIIEDSYKINVNKVSLDDVEITYAFDILPVVSVANYKNIPNLKLANHSVTDKEVDESIKAIAGKEELNDESIKKLKLNGINTVEDLKKHQKQALLWKKEEEELIKLRNEVGKEIVKRTTIDYIPESILKQEQNMLIRQYNTNHRGAKVILDAIIEDDEEAKKLPLNEKMKKIANYTVTLSLALEKIMEENDLELTDKDREEYAKKLAFASCISLEDAKKRLSGEESEASMLNEKIIKAIVQMNNVESKN